MKQKWFLAVMILVISSSAIAQEGRGRGQGGFQRRTVEERVAVIHQKFDSTFKFDAKKQALIDSAFATQYRASDKMREEMMAAVQANGGQPDPSMRETMQEKMKEINVARDEKLQTILNETEYTKWKKELEPSMRPARGMGGPGGGQGGGRREGGGN